MENEEIKTYLSNLKEKKPLIHCITNYVTVNDVANSLIAIGASPVMADEPSESGEITAISNGLLINLGTLNLNTIKAMQNSIKMANSLNLPVVLDPVGVGASTLRNETAINFLKEYKFSIIKGNISEIKFLNGEKSIAKGVDAGLKDLNDDILNRVNLAKELSKKTDAAIVITGKIDVVAFENEVYLLKNGSSLMGKFSGSGCILGGICTAFLASNTNPLKSAIMGVLTECVAGELVRGKNVLSDMGSMKFKNGLIDEIYLIDDKKLQDLAKIEKVMK
ncbi:hydroxyethylthiazole kinase [Campylobacter ureolyticus]|uniref:Hydroxyethylthiazole kinase n=1 Tax=Campylobacter ureolyticus TaxID=827 RepID=A0A9Q4PV43_9BACT|nr:hydroxyethylthiazole kinase [Campylobacter ureolyticus]MCZ6159971.1 hydroxyethylthiazole kinase [Campylobacter ureolyticus]MCZ6163830.1 hydroxyethylthiazole kinase [Campylobacter ureolyticus]MCZ6165554.1 hydroxyethylthiazole kinase [Campylobacter ureolyticus]MCZ6167228.1 hydroxyethylthiazole kinase [Campylobacter ureolyticus]